MKKGKGCNLAAGIIDVILASFLIIAGVYYLIVGAAINDGSEELAMISQILLVAGVVGLLLGAGYLTMGVLSIKYANESPEKYYTKKNAYLTFSIIESIILVYFIYSVIVVGDVFAVISLLMYLSTIVLHWIGFGMMTKGHNQITDNGVVIEVKQNVELPQEKQEVETQNQSFNEDMYAKLTKLNELKQNGIISEEEFQKMKNDILNK